MNHTREQLPEELELERKQAELEAKQEALADLELELLNLQTRLMQFERLYMEKVGRLYVELDNLQAQVLSRRSDRNPGDARAFEAAKEAKQKAAQSRQEYEQHIGAVTQMPMKEASQEVKILFRELAKMFHPDTTLDPKEKEYRSAIMARVNDAYSRGDLQALQEISRTMKSAPEAVSGEGIGADLIRVIRKIAQIDTRIQKVQGEIAALKNSELFKILEQYEEWKQQGRDLLETLAADIRHRIAELKALKENK